MNPHKVLYIEDDEGDFARMKSGIDPSLCEVIGEVDGERAVERIRADKPLKAIKAVLLDAELIDPKTKLPQPLQGGDVARKIRDIRPDLPLFAVSWFRSGSLSVPVDGVYPKVTLFASPSTFKDLEEALSDAISKTEMTTYSPYDGGGTRWKDKWGREYEDFRKSQQFQVEEIKLGQMARQDYDAFADGAIGVSYRRYRGAGNLNNVLISRRVIFAAVLSNYDTNSGIPWKEVSDFLGFKFPEDEVPDPNRMHNGLQNYMSECAIKWGNIINRDTMLPEEKEWLKRERFIS